MRLINFILTLLLLIVILVPLLHAQDTISDTTSSVPFKIIAQEFTSTLQGVLMAEMKKSGPEGAVSVCSDTALQLTEEIGKKYNVEIRRISLKHRNPKNAPRNEGEREMLIRMEQENIDALVNPANEASSKQLNDPKYFSSPIKIGAPCLQCHGSEDQIKPETLKKINSVYPNDKAKGYKAGDFRGALVIERK